MSSRPLLRKSKSGESVSPGAAGGESPPEEQTGHTEDFGYADHGAGILLHDQQHQPEDDHGYPYRDVLHGDAE